MNFEGGKQVIVPGDATASQLDFLHLPDGFCAHVFATVPNARQLRFAPGGELFVTSPTGLTTGGGPGGLASIVVLPDDNHDGVADKPVTFMANMPETQGILFTPGFFYYQDNTKILRIPYTSGQRTASGTAEMQANVTFYSSTVHWPKAMDVADDGSIFIGNGGDQLETCDPAHPFHGGVLKLDGSTQGAQIAKGLRNPIAIRCSHGHNVCFALELAKDQTGPTGGREKLIPIRTGDDWGFPCCATTNMPYSDSPAGTDCSTVTPESVGFLIGDTPFALAFTPGTWPAAYQNLAIVAAHGDAVSWRGARMLTVTLDPKTGLPTAAADTSGSNTGSMSDFATGWDDATGTHGRPAALDFAADGRLFVANDRNGLIFWVAPIGA